MNYVTMWVGPAKRMYHERKRAEADLVYGENVVYSGFQMSKNQLFRSLFFNERHAHIVQVLLDLLPDVCAQLVYKYVSDTSSSNKAHKAIVFQTKKDFVPKLVNRSGFEYL